MYEAKCLNTKSHGRAYSNKALSEHIEDVYLWVLFGEELIYPNHGSQIFLQKTRYI
jgi:hypothetical protein